MEGDDDDDGVLVRDDVVLDFPELPKRSSRSALLLLWEDYFFFFFESPDSPNSASRLAEASFL